MATTQITKGSTAKTLANIDRILAGPEPDPFAVGDHDDEYALEYLGGLCDCSLCRSYPEDDAMWTIEDYGQRGSRIQGLFSLGVRDDEYATSYDILRQYVEGRTALDAESLLDIIHIVTGHGAADPWIAEVYRDRPIPKLREECDRGIIEWRFHRQPRYRRYYAKTNTYS